MRSIIILCSIVAGSLSTEPPLVLGLEDYCKNGKTAQMRATTESEGLEGIVKQYSDLYFELSGKNLQKHILRDFKKEFCYIMNKSRNKQSDLTILLGEMNATNRTPQLSFPTMEDLPQRIGNSCPGVSLESLHLSEEDYMSILNYYYMRFVGLGNWRLADYLRDSKHKFCNLLTPNFFSFRKQFKFELPKLIALNKEMAEKLTEVETSVLSH